MKQIFVLSALLAAAGLCTAQETGRVISSTPVIQQVGVPRQVCSNEAVLTQPSTKSGAGALLGAVAGGAAGNAVGPGSGRAAATVLGILGGAMLGDRIEGPSQPQVQNVQRCSTQTFYENRTVGYNVVYEYAGRQYTVQMPSDPGPTVRLQITPISSAPPPSAPSTDGGYVQPVQPIYVQPPVLAPTTYTTPVYPTYYAQPYYVQPYYAQPYYAQPYFAPVALSLGFSFHSGHRHHRHGH